MPALLVVCLWASGGIASVAAEKPLPPPNEIAAIERNHALLSEDPLTTRIRQGILSPNGGVKAYVSVSGRSLEMTELNRHLLSPAQAKSSAKALHESQALNPPRPTPGLMARAFEAKPRGRRQHPARQATEQLMRLGQRGFRIDWGERRQNPKPSESIH